MSETAAFLPGTPLRIAQADPRVVQAYSSPCCSSSRPSCRRVFLKRLISGTTTVLLSSVLPRSIRAEADALKSPVQAPRGKPRKVTWGYAEENGPAQWGSLNEDWALCDTGLEQSPIALSYRGASSPNDAPRPSLDTASGKIIVRMRDANPDAANKSLVVEPYIPPPPPLVGDAPPVDVYKPPPPLAVITLPDVGVYILKSFHFHVGASEHVIDGNQGVMETHFIFEKSARQPPQEKPATPPQPSGSDSGMSLAATAAADEVVQPASAADAPSAPQVLVVGLPGIRADNSEPWLKGLVDNFPFEETESESRPPSIVMEIDLGDVLPNFDNASFYMYSGSLTTPPGTEGVYWLVLAERMGAAAKDLEVLMRAQNGPNIRPLQPLNNRKVTRFRPVTVPGE